MAEFQYQGVDKQGKRINGKIEAANEGDLRMILRGQGVRPTRISKVTLLHADLKNIGNLFRGNIGAGYGEIGLAPLAVFTRQLQVLLSSGIPLVQALEVLVDQTPDPTIKKIFTIVREKISQGTFFWEALSQFKGAFPRVYIALIRAAEISGAMDTVLDRLAKYLENIYKLIRMVRGAMIYPIAVTVVGLAVMIGMLVFVIPKFEEIFRQQQQQLPGITQMLVNASQGFRNHWVMIAGCSVGFFYLFRYYAKTPEGKAFLDRVMFSAPIFGPLLQKAGIARFSRTLGTLLGSGVNLIDSIDICKTTIDNAVLEDAVAKIRRDIEAGKSLSAVLNQIKVFPKMTVQMINVGEQTGSLEKMLDKIADIYETDVETMVAGLGKLIEPIILVVLGGSVAVMMIALYMPVFKMAG